MISRLIVWCLGNRFLVLAAMAFLAVAGIWGLATIPVDAVPDLSDVQVIVVTEWEGQNPQIVEDQVTYPLTVAMQRVAGVRDVRGFSYFGISFVYLIFEDRTDLYWARERVLEYLTEVTPKLPRGAQPRLGPDATGLGWIYMYTLEDTRGRFDLGELRAIHDWNVSFVLRSVRGVAEVAVFGGAPRRYEILPDPFRLQALGLTVPDLASAVERANSDSGGMLVEAADREYMIQGRGYLRSAKDIEDVILYSTKRRTPVRVKDVAEVTIAPETVRGISDKDGLGEAIAGIVVMRQDENALEVIRNVRHAIEHEIHLPEGVVLRTAHDRSALIERAMGTLKSALITELGMLAIVIFVFLVHVRSCLVAFITLPMGALAAFLVMKLLGINANIMSLSGIALAFGAMVDASIALVENTHRHMERGETGSRMEVLSRACVEVGPGLFFSLLVVTVGFLPIFALEGQAGRLFKPLAFTKTFAMAAASILSITLIPPLIWFFVRGKFVSEEKNLFTLVLLRLYAPVVRWVMAHPWRTVTAALVVILATVGPFLKLLERWEFMPPLEEGDLLWMPTSPSPGLGVAEGRRALQVHDRLLKTFPEVQSVLGKMGRSSTATDPAPLDMMETNARLYDEFSWPKRAVRKGWIAARVGEAARAVDSSLDAQSFEETIRPEVNERIRLTLLAALEKERLAFRRPDSPALPGLLLPEEQEEYEKHRFSLQHEILEDLAPRIAQWIDAEILDHARSSPAAGEVENLRKWLKASGKTVPLERVTFEEMTRQEMGRTIQMPGLPNWPLMPIQTRIGMLTTGMRGYLGLKVYGADYERVEKLSTDLEQILLREVEGTRAAVAERAATGGTYLDIVIDRDACARYGVNVQDVQTIVMLAMGGMRVTETVEGRSRFAVVVRYPRELRDDPERLKRVLVPIPSDRMNGMASMSGMGGMRGAAVVAGDAAARPSVVTLGQLAKIEIRPGPMAIKSENNRLVVFLPVEFAGMSPSEYVRKAQKAIDKAVQEERLEMPAGYALRWSGQYELIERTGRRLQLIVPLTLGLIFLVLFLHFRRFSNTLIVMGATLFFAPLGGVWLLHLLGHNLSVATIVGFIALMGIAAETGIIMLVYIDNAVEERLQKHGRMTRALLDEAIREGSLARVRPKVMTVLNDVFGLTPLLWATGAGAATLQRMTAPLVGGIVSSMILTLVVIPAVYKIVHGARLPRSE